MPILRVLVLCAVLVEAVWISLHVPWMAETVFNDVPLTASLDAAPFFKPPGRPDLKVFQNRLSPFLDPKSVEIEITVDRIALYQRFAAAVVGTFFLYGLAGYFLTRPPRPADVAYSLALTTGYIIGSVASAITAQIIPDHGPFPWIHLFWAAGVGIAFIVTVRGRREIPAA